MSTIIVIECAEFVLRNTQCFPLNPVATSIASLACVIINVIKVSSAVVVTRQYNFASAKVTGLLGPYLDVETMVG